MKNSNSFAPLLTRPFLREEIDCEFATRRLGQFVRQAWAVVEPSTPFVPGWHIDAIIEHLEAVTCGQIRNLLINVPPRHMKSLLVAVLWPAWEWIRHPERRWLYDPSKGWSKSRNSPWSGQELTGRVLLTFVDGRLVYDLDRGVLVP